jgi:hypothetical protein
MANVAQTLGQNVLQEELEKLHTRQRFLFPPVVFAPVLVREHDSGLVVGCWFVVGGGDDDERCAFANRH